MYRPRDRQMIQREPETGSHYYLTVLRLTCNVPVFVWRIKTWLQDDILALGAVPLA